jgi:hypothetical protein
MIEIAIGDLIVRCDTVNEAVQMTQRLKRQRKPAVPAFEEPEPEPKRKKPKLKVSWAKVRRIAEKHGRNDLQQVRKEVYAGTLS